jgi:hypothetical protein
VITFFGNLDLLTRVSEHNAAASAVSSVASWDFDYTLSHSVPGTPKYRKVNTLFKEHSSVNQVEFELQDEILFEYSGLSPTAPNQPGLAVDPTYSLDTDAKSEQGSERVDTESSSSSSLPSTPPSQSLEAHVLSSSPPNALPNITPNITPELQNKNQGGVRRKLTGSRKTTENTSLSQSGIEKSNSLSRSLSPRFLNSR